MIEKRSIKYPYFVECAAATCDDRYWHTVFTMLAYDEAPGHYKSSDVAALSTGNIEVDIPEFKSYMKKLNRVQDTVDNNPKLNSNFVPADWETSRRKHIRELLDEARALQLIDNPDKWIQIVIEKNMVNQKSVIPKKKVLSQ